MITIYNKHMVAVSSSIASDVSCTELNPFEDFATKYGLFFPFDHFGGLPFLDWINSDFKMDVLGNDTIGMREMGFVHIDNAGRVFIIQVSARNNWIGRIRYSGERFHSGGMSDKEFVYTDELIKDCTKLSEACAIIDERTIHGISEPQIIFVKDWVDHAEKHGLSKTDIFSANCFKKT